MVMDNSGFRTECLDRSDVSISIESKFHCSIFSEIKIGEIESNMKRREFGWDHLS